MSSSINPAVDFRCPTQDQIPEKSRSEDSSKRRKTTAALNAAPRQGRLAALLISTVALFVYTGLRIKKFNYIDAEFGLGYVLGIVGSLCMVLLLLYPVRKRLRLMKKAGSVRFWFRLHLALGVIGPLLVLYHANFKLGSFHSSLALASTILVTLSGFVGLFLHTRIHFGLHGQRLSLNTLCQNLPDHSKGFEVILKYAPRLKARLEKLESYSCQPPSGLAHGVLRIITIGLWARWTRERILMSLPRTVRVVASRTNWTESTCDQVTSEVLAYLETYTNRILKVAEFGFYERLLALWHLFHYPLFLLLLVLGTVHVVAVHMY